MLESPMLNSDDYDDDKFQAPEMYIWKVYGRYSHIFSIILKFVMFIVY